MATNLEILNRELAGRFDATPFRTVFGGTEIETWVRGKDGVRRRVAFALEDFIRYTPAQLVGHLIEGMRNAAEVGAPKPFCLHCGREY